MTTAKPTFADLSDDLRQVVEAWLVEFDQSWDEHRLAVQVLKLAWDHPLRRLALAEMVKIDLERQWQRGRQVALESYLRAYPELGTRDSVAADLIQGEYDARAQAGVPADLADFDARFPGQAAELRQRVEQATREAAASTTHQEPVHGQGPLSTLPVALAPSTPSLPEQFGRYRIVKLLGQGGMGSVYLAHDTQLDRAVALKVPRFTVNDGPEALERFHREARAAAGLRHPHICPVYDVGQIGDLHYLTMAYIEGQTFAERVQASPLPPAEAAALVRVLAQALEVAHRHGVIHRDLKPANVMLNQEGEPAIMDFGLARRVNCGDERLTSTGSIMGTPAYMSPEQVQGDVAAMGPGCDIYSLGVILYELLTGTLPFRGSVGTVLGEIISKVPERPSLLRPELSPELEGIVMKAMMKKPAERYASMGEFAQALGDYLDAPESPPAPVNRVARYFGARAAQRSPARPLSRRLWGIAAALVLVLLVGRAALMIRFSGQEPQPVGSPKAPIVIGPEEPSGEVINCKVWELSPDGRTLVNLNYKTAELWDAQTGKKLATLPAQDERVVDVAFSPDGKKVAIIAWKEVKVWDVKAAKELYTITEHGTYVSALFFSADGKELHSVDVDGMAVVTDAATGKNLKKNPVKGIQTTAARFDWGLTPDTKTFADFSKARLVDTGTWEGQSYETPFSVYSAAIISNERALFMGTHGEVAFFDLGGRTVQSAGHKTEMIHKLHTGDVWSASLSPDGKLVASGGGKEDKTAIVWDLKQKKELARLTGFDGPVNVRFSPDGKTLVATSNTKREVRRYDVATGKELPVFGDHESGVHQVLFCMSGKCLAVVGTDRMLTLYDVASLPK